MNFTAVLQCSLCGKKVEQLIIITDQETKELELNKSKEQFNVELYSYIKGLADKIHTCLDISGIRSFGQLKFLGYSELKANNE